MLAPRTFPSDFTGRRYAPRPGLGGIGDFFENVWDTVSDVAEGALDTFTGEGGPLGALEMLLGEEKYGELLRKILPNELEDFLAEHGPQLAAVLGKVPLPWTKAAALVVRAVSSDVAAAQARAELARYGVTVDPALADAARDLLLRAGYAAPGGLAPGTAPVGGILLLGGAAALAWWLLR